MKQFFKTVDMPCDNLQSLAQLLITLNLNKPAHLPH